MSGIGVSFGADRIYDLMLERSLFPEKLELTTRVLFVNFGEREAHFCLSLVAQLRENGISTELYPDSAKMKKQMKYADSRLVEYVVLVGEEEIETGEIKVKEMTSGEQHTTTIAELMQLLQNN